MRQKFESEIDEIELLIEKSSKDKGSNQKSEKKLERDQRDQSRKLDTLEKEVQTSTEKQNSLNKELSKTNDDIKKSQRKFAELDSTNKILTKDLDLYKTKGKDIDDEELRIQLLTTKIPSSNDSNRNWTINHGIIC